MAPKTKQPRKSAGKPALGRSVLANIRDMMAAKQAMAMRGPPGAIPNGGVTPSPVSFTPGMGGAAGRTQ